jgi:hypothetical protein
MESSRPPWEVRDAPPGQAPDGAPVTGAPIEESDRGGKVPAPTTGRFKGLLAVGLGIALIMAVAAAVGGGISYAIPVVVLTVVVLGFVGFHRLLGRQKSARHGDRVRDEVASDSEDPVPHFGFEEKTALGADSDAGTQDAEEHSEMRPGTGG